jgi:hypothetical protein
MNVSQDSGMLPSKSKSISISTRQRTLLHRLLHRQLRRCSTPSLDAFERLGWISGLAGGYELTERGRAIAEFSEQTILDGELEISLP